MLNALHIEYTKHLLLLYKRLIPLKEKVTADKVILYITNETALLDFGLLSVYVLLLAYGVAIAYKTFKEPANDEDTKEKGYYLAEDKRLGLKQKNRKSSKKLLADINIEPKKRKQRRKRRKKITNFYEKFPIIK